MIQWKVYTHCQLLSQANLMPSWMRSDEQLTALNTWFSVLCFLLSPQSPQSGIPSYFPLTFSLQNLLWIVPSCFFQSLSRVRLFAIPWTAAHQASLSITNSQSLLKLMSIKLVMPLSHLVLCHQLLLLPSNFPSIRVFSNELVLHVMWPKYWSFSFNISPSNEHPGPISLLKINENIYPHKDFYLNLQCSTKHNSPKLETIQTICDISIQWNITQQ